MQPKPLSRRGAFTVLAAFGASAADSTDQTSPMRLSFLSNELAPADQVLRRQCAVSLATAAQLPGGSQMGSPDQHCVVTLVERTTGYVLIGKLRDRSAQGLTRQVISMIQREPEGSFKTITSDNGTEFHSYKEVEAATGVTFYFATPHHAWERGTNENTNGLLRQYLPKRMSMAKITQERCDFLSRELNDRPRKRHRYFTPEEMRHAA